MIPDVESPQVRVPELQRKAGVFYAVSDDGIELPVIDVTHPGFAIDESDPRVRQLFEEQRRRQDEWDRRPFWLRRIMFWYARRNSVLLEALASEDSTFLSAMATYLMKLGPEHLGSAYTRRFDHRIAGTGSILDVRLRLQRMAHLLAESLGPVLAARAAAPVHFVNIAGGPAIDSINAVILLAKTAPRLLAGRSVRIHVLDANEAGPHFGARALGALRGAEGPLAGVDCRLEYRRYDWNDPAALRELLRSFEPNAVAVGSSEGGLFQYGSDEAIVANLAVLREATPPDFQFSGSVSPDTVESKAGHQMIRIRLRHFAPETFAALVGRAGWRVERKLEGFRTDCVRLAKN
jgi:hypothetical protein